MNPLANPLAALGLESPVLPARKLLHSFFT
jgi:hypothetical protein